MTVADRCRRARFASETQAHGAAASVGDPYRPRHCAQCGYWHIVSDEAPTFRLSPSLARAVLRGDKTTHRVPAGRVRYCPYLVGHTYALEYEQSLTNELGDAVNDRHGRQRTTFATDTVLHVTRIERERLEDIDDEAAGPEGFKTFAEFLDYWNETYNPDHAGVDPERRHLSERRMRGAVWVIHFVAEHQDTVHLLPNLPHEPEAVDPALVVDLPASIEAQQRWHLDRAGREAHYADLTPGERLDLALERARELRNPEALKKARYVSRFLVEIERSNDRAA